jgi:hypothetical protein
MFHTVPEGQTVKNRGDFDLQAADAAAEADRLTRLGASRSAHWTTVSSLADWPATLDRSAPTPPKREMLLSKGVAS